MRDLFLIEPNILVLQFRIIMQNSKMTHQWLNYVCLCILIKQCIHIFFLRVRLRISDPPKPRLNGKWKPLNGVGTWCNRILSWCWYDWELSECAVYLQYCAFRSWVLWNVPGLIYAVSESQNRLASTECLSSFGETSLQVKMKGKLVNIQANCVKRLTL